MFNTSIPIPPNIKLNLSKLITRDSLIITILLVKVLRFSLYWVLFNVNINIVSRLSEFKIFGCKFKILFDFI